jgi:hypothetical protein
MARKRTVEESVARSAPPPPVEQEPQKVSASELGPAVTEDFPDAIGLHEVRGSTGGPRPVSAATLPGAPAPTPPQIDYTKLIQDLLSLIDTATSAVLGITPETPETLKTPATCMAPWVTAHAGDLTSETGMRLLAISGILTFAAMKIIKWAQKPRPKPRPDVATAAGDEFADPDIVAAAEGRE